MAGITQIRRFFLLLDAIGALLFIGAIAALGWTFQTEITGAVDKLAAFGLWGAVAALIALALYMAASWVQRRFVHP